MPGLIETTVLNSKFPIFRRSLMRTELYDQDGKGTRKFVLLATYKPAVTSRNGMEWGYRSAVYGFEKLCFGEILCILELQKEKLKTNS